MVAISSTTAIQNYSHPEQVSEQVITFWKFLSQTSDFAVQNIPHNPSFRSVES
ncbi:MAG: hypothetical protein MUF49_18445 [Oculatellaceae cyanobacterium Prado106]|nr:hypothetical protein [Oculatellaceae cyanobacterium Prado106]